MNVWCLCFFARFEGVFRLVVMKYVKKLTQYSSFVISQRRKIYSSIPVKSCSRSLLLRSCLKALLLSKKHIFIINCSVCHFSCIIAL